MANCFGKFSGVKLPPECNGTECATCKVGALEDRKVSEFRVHCHGIDGSQYFPGHGLWGGSFQDCATGIGDTEAEAFEDALDQLASNGWEISEETEKAMRADLAGRTDDAHDDCAPEDGEDPEGDWHGACELHHWVSVDVK